MPAEEVAAMTTALHQLTTAMTSLQAQVAENTRIREQSSRTGAERVDERGGLGERQLPARAAVLPPDVESTSGTSRRVDVVQEAASSTSASPRRRRRRQRRTRRTRRPLGWRR